MSRTVYLLLTAATSHTGQHRAPERVPDGRHPVPRADLTPFFRFPPGSAPALGGVGADALGGFRASPLAWPGRGTPAAGGDATHERPSASIAGPADGRPTASTNDGAGAPAPDPDRAVHGPGRGSPHHLDGGAP